MFEIIRVYESETKKSITRGILEALREWFGIAEAREEYIAQSVAEPFWYACDGDKPIGFLYVHQTGDATLELYAMGVLKEYHRSGAGRALFAAAYEYARANGYCFIQVKTVQMGKYVGYDKTNLFYRSLGFREFEVFPKLWDEWNPCQVYVMAVK